MANYNGKSIPTDGSKDIITWSEEQKNDIQNALPKSSQLDGWFITDYGFKKVLEKSIVQAVTANTDTTHSSAMPSGYSTNNFSEYFVQVTLGVPSGGTDKSYISYSYASGGFVNYRIIPGTRTQNVRVTIQITFYS